MGEFIAFSPPFGSEWIVILLALVLLFGAKKLPELGSSVGKTITNFKKGVAEGKEEFDEARAEADGDGEVEAGEEADAGDKPSG